jgi:hypothetical protein
VVPFSVNIIGYFVASFAIFATFLVSLNYKKLAVWGFSIWIGTNSFELFVFSYYYHNIWASCQFSVYLILAAFAVMRYNKP